MKRTSLAAVIGLAALTAGCTGTAGTPQPGPTSGGTATNTSTAASGLGSLKPCDLLTQAEVTALGLEFPGEAQKLGAADTCYWKVSGNGGLSAGIRTEAGLKDLSITGDKKSDVKVGKFDAVKAEGFEGAKNSCALWIAVTGNSTISVISGLDLTSEDTAAACDRAAKAADDIVAKLP
ncbi:Protein of unknown function [Lentzea xinjiangensis]|uniref:DUF3558 domain-containing protein n=1 Tax=Lentzea xinjiangensis TaxID=402600 RepID=A0A1H9MFD7_9PSEU|nr:DUF3558 family protein [Lentzea xinjiangensis]SER22219.1 Protein of unknown function [Lentzea xinjiangensis]